MRLSDWIKNIRWKYFTNEKAGLISKELMKEFEMVNKMTENKRYHYHDFEEYCTITDTNKYPKDLNDFYNELVQEGYLEDYDGDKEVVLELAEEKYQEYLEDHCMSTKEIIDLMNGQAEEIKKLREMGQELYEWDNKRSLYILQVMQNFARQYSQDSIEFNLLYELGKELPINPNNLWPKEAFKEDEGMIE